MIESRVLLASFFSSNIRGGEGRRENQSKSRCLFHMNLKKSSNNRDFLQILPFCTYFQKSVFLLFLPYTWLSFFIYNFVYLFVYFYFWPCCDFVAARPFPGLREGSSSPLVACRLLTWWVLLLPTTGSRHVGFSSCSSWTQDCVSRALEHRRRLSCSTPCGIFLGQGSNPCPLHWQAYSSPLSHQGHPRGFLISGPLKSS